MSDPDFDRSSWDQRWTRALRDHGDRLAERPPNSQLLEAAAALPPGRALDAGCGHGAEALWLAARGWQVTAVDFSATALAYARGAAETIGADVAARIEWVEGDLGSWAPEPERFQLVTCLYVHVAGSVTEMVRRLADGVAPAGRLLLVGHQPIDPATGLETPAAGQTQVSLATGTGALDPDRWRLLVAQERQRAAAGTGVDAVIYAELI